MAWCPRRRPQATEQRIDRAVALMAEIDRLMAGRTPEQFAAEMARLKPEVDQVNMSTVCDKRELKLDVTGPKLRYSQVAQMLVAGHALRRAWAGVLPRPFRRLQPVYAQPSEFLSRTQLDSYRMLSQGGDRHGKRHRPGRRGSLQGLRAVHDGVPTGHSAA